MFASFNFEMGGKMGRDTHSPRVVCEEMQILLANSRVFRKSGATWAVEEYKGTWRDLVETGL